MTSPLTVRRALQTDASAIARIHNQGIEERGATFETALRTVEGIEALLREKGDRYPTIVTVRGGDVVAWAAVSPYSSRECYAGIAEFSVYTERSARGTGAGRAAMEGLFRACEERGFWKLTSRVFPENRASLTLLGKLGFRQVGTHRRHAKVDGVWHDCIIVEKLLGEALEA
jgi:L-amino acid N-acyltransferase YncA